MSGEPQRVLLVTGLAGAGKTTALHALEDLGWEVVDNAPVRLLDRMIGGEDAAGPLAIGFNSHTRGFDPVRMIALVKGWTTREDVAIETLYLECDDAELQRRYNETRRRHPLGGPTLRGRPVNEAIGAERALMAPLKRWAERVIDTTALSAPELRQTIRERFDTGVDALNLTISSFGYGRGMPPLADLVFDMRFLANPHWDDALRPLTGRDAAVGEHVRADPAYDEAFERIGGLVAFLLPRYRAQGRGYLHVAIGCTGGRHRSVFVAEELARRLAELAPTVLHRDLASRAIDAIEGLQPD